MSKLFLFSCDDTIQDLTIDTSLLNGMELFALHSTHAKIAKN